MEAVSSRDAARCEGSRRLYLVRRQLLREWRLTVQAGGLHAKAATTEVGVSDMPRAVFGGAGSAVDLSPRAPVRVQRACTRAAPRACSAAGPSSFDEAAGFDFAAFPSCSRAADAVPAAPRLIGPFGPSHEMCVLRCFAEIVTASNSEQIIGSESSGDIVEYRPKSAEISRNMR